MYRRIAAVAALLCACGAAPPSLPAAGWDGSYITLAVGQSETTTPPAAYNAVLLDNLGSSTSTVLLTFGGAPPLALQLPPETNTPVYFIDNFAPGNLNVFDQRGSPIGAEVLGIGIPARTGGSDPPTPLPFGVPLPLPPGHRAQAISAPSWMNLSVTTTTNALTTFIIFGGTTPPPSSTTRAIVLQLNAATPAGPISGTPFDNALPQPTGSSLDPAGPLIYAATTSASYDLLYDWGASTILVANTSATTAAGASITLTSL